MCWSRVWLTSQKLCLLLSINTFSISSQPHRNPSLSLFLALAGLCLTVAVIWLETQALWAVKDSHRSTSPTANVPGTSQWVHFEFTLHTRDIVSRNKCLKVALCLSTRFQRAMLSCCPSGCLTWRLILSAALTMWRCITDTLTWYRSSGVSVERSGLELSFPHPTPWW